MASRLRMLACALCLGGAVIGASAATPEPRVLGVGAFSKSLEWDAAWQVAAPEDGAAANTVRFQTANPHDLQVLVTAQGRPSAHADVDAFMRHVIQSATQEFGKHSVEQSLEPKGFSNGGTRGYTVCATDRAPKPDEYRYVCQGVATADDVVVIFTVLYNDAGKSLAKKATHSLEALQIARKT